KYIQTNKHPKHNTNIPSTPRPAPRGAPPPPPNLNLEKPISIKCRRALKLSDLTFCADGSVSICCFDYNRELIIGNILNDSFETIINSEKTKQIQKILSSENVLNSDLICKNCDQIRDRSDALIYTSDNNMRVGKNSMQTFA
ncbi:MAG: SPASM domain-containing protein, partial [Helicobacteraceae bacterium]|nr:SPASM domain-containing protein [Helicobacteraceae bacterium]